MIDLCNPLPSCPRLASQLWFMCGKGVGRRGPPRTNFTWEKGDKNSLFRAGYCSLAMRGVCNTQARPPHTGAAGRLPHMSLACRRKAHVQTSLAAGTFNCMHAIHVTRQRVHFKTRARQKDLREATSRNEYQMSFSGAVKLDLSDFIAPSQACVVTSLDGNKLQLADDQNVQVCVLPFPSPSPSMNVTSALRDCPAERTRRRSNRRVGQCSCSVLLRSQHPHGHPAGLPASLRPERRRGPAL